MKVCVFYSLVWSWNADGVPDNFAVEKLTFSTYILIILNAISNLYSGHSMVIFSPVLFILLVEITLISAGFMKVKMYSPSGNLSVITDLYSPSLGIIGYIMRRMPSAVIGETVMYIECFKTLFFCSGMNFIVCVCKSFCNMFIASLTRSQSTQPASKPFLWLISAYRADNRISSKLVLRLLLIWLSHFL